MAISMLKIRRPLGRLIFNMGIAIPGKTVFLIETAPCSLQLEYALEWLLSGHSMIVLIIPQGPSKWWLEKFRMQDISNLINDCRDAYQILERLKKSKHRPCIFEIYYKT